MSSAFGRRSPPFDYAIDVIKVVMVHNQIISHTYGVEEPNFVFNNLWTDR
jgi:hypothetical protein